MTTFPQVQEAMADLLSRKRQRAESCSDDEREEDASDAPLCQVCHRHPRKYCCPRCATLTCSLACCTAHKKARGCDGKRDVAAYAKAQTMGLRDLRQDCAFIESVERSQLTASREFQRGEAARLGGSARRRGGGGAAQRLQRAAERRRVRLLLMPEGMGRRARNSSRYDGKRDALDWRVEWTVEIGGDKVAAFVDEAADERAPLRDLLAAHVAALDAGARARLEPVFREPPALLLLRTPGPANDPAYDRVDASVGLHLALLDKCVIEYPQLKVVAPGDVGGRYKLAPSAVQLLFDDDETDATLPESEVPTPTAR